MGTEYLKNCCQCGNKEDSEDDFYNQCELCGGWICNDEDCVVFPTEDPQEEALCYDCAVSAGYFN